jgi:hypothetical protein
MMRISCTRLGLAALLLAALGAAACDSQGCGQPAEDTEAKAPAPITCGAGTHLQAGQCVATETAQTH